MEGGERALGSPLGALQLPKARREGAAPRRRVAVSRLALFAAQSRQAWPAARGRCWQKGREGGRWEAGGHAGSSLGGRKGSCEQGPYSATLHLAAETHEQQLEAYTKEALAEPRSERYCVLYLPKMG